MRITLLLIALFCIIGSNAQETNRIQSKEQAIEILRNSGFTSVIRCNGETEEDVDVFIAEIDNITSLSIDKRNKLKQQLLDVIEKKRGFWTDYTLVCLPMGHPAFIGTGANKIFKENFIAAEYDIIMQALSSELINVSSAYSFLRKTWIEELRQEDPGSVLGFGTGSVGATLDHFGI